jgi:hypothetical protein
VLNSDYKDMLQVLSDGLIRSKRATGRHKGHLDADRLKSEKR